MDGLYLYCIREKTKGAVAISAKGIDESKEVFILPFRQLEAVVSTVNLDEFASEQVQTKARDDVNWIKEKSIAHERVIEEAMIKDDKLLSLIPMRFGIILKSRTALGQSLDKDYPKIMEVLEKVRGKQEWSVKVYLMNKENFEEVIKEKNEKLKQKQREIASLPEGMAFFIEEELRSIVAKEADKELNNIINNLFDRLAKQSGGSVKNRILARELTGRREPMVLNSAYLVCEKKIECFKKEVEDLKKEIYSKGLCLEYSGPWPAFNFTSY